MYDSISIDTTQNVSINLVKASLGDRLLAFIIDIIIKAVYILSLILVAVFIFNTKSIFNDSQSETEFMLIVILLIILYLPIFLYDVLFEILMDGQTPGKKVMKIKVVNLDGESLSLGACIIRWLFRIIDFMPLLYGLVGLISIAVTKNSQRIGDILAKTTVIKTKNLVELRDTVFQMLRDDHQAEFPSVVRLSSRDIEIIKQVLNKPEYKNNTDVTEKLFFKIKTMLDIETDYDAVTFLKKVVDDYTYYG